MMPVRKKIKKWSVALTILISTFLWTGPALAESEKGSENPSYLIGPTDVLRVHVWKEAELTIDVTVMPDGKITFPLIGEIQAAGRNVTELKKTITEKLQNFVTAPEVTVIVQQSLSRHFYTLGNLNRPGPYPLLPGMTVLQAISTAGGFAQWADEKNILIVRKEGAKEVQLRFNYKVYVSGKNLEQNILLKPNDTIVVP